MIPDAYLEDLKLRLAAQAEDVCRRLLTGGKRNGSRWVCGGVDGGAGKSMYVDLQGGTAGLWRDAATGEGGDLLKLWQDNQGCTFPEAVAATASFCGMLPPDTREAAPDLGKIDSSNFTYEPPSEESDATPQPSAGNDDLPDYNPNAGRDQPQGVAGEWRKAVKALTAEHKSKLAEWRGFSPDFIDWMHRQDLIGVHNGCYAFPVHDGNGKVVRIHYRLERSWAYHPKGGDSAPLVIGNPIHATHTLAFESQWDALAILDKLGAHLPENEGIYASYITRGATSNTNLSKVAIPHLIAFPQNDPPEKASKTTGRTPAEEWLHKLQTTRHPVTEFAVCETPQPHKDANDWIREENPDHFQVFRKAIEGAKNPILAGIRTILDLQKYPVKDDPNSLIGYEGRFLGKGGTWFWIGPSGIGKSTLLTDFALHAACGMDWHGVKFRRPLKTLIIQAENDEGDMAEMMNGAFRINGKKNELREATAYGLILKNFLLQQETERTGKRFCQWLEEIIRETKVDLICIDPILSYVGDDVSLQKVCAQFFRDYLGGVIQRTQTMCLMNHHTGKPLKGDAKSTKGWSESDFSYLGLGSSDMVNWARAVSVIVPTKLDGTFMFKTTKRASRMGMLDKFTGMATKEIYLRHGNPDEGLVWVETKYEGDEEEDEPPKKRGGKKESDEPPDMDALAALIPDKGMSFVDFVKAVRKSAGVPYEKAKMIASKMLMARIITNDGSTWYVKRA